MVGHKLINQKDRKVQFGRFVQKDQQQTEEHVNANRNYGDWRNDRRTRMLAPFSARTRCYAGAGQCTSVLTQ
jgi:hypothetical protein